MKNVSLDGLDPACCSLGGNDVYVVPRDNAEKVRRVVIVFDSGSDGTVQRIFSVVEARALAIAILKAAEG